MSLSQGIKNPQKEWMFKGLSITIPSIKKPGSEVVTFDVSFR